MHGDEDGKSHGTRNFKEPNYHLIFEGKQTNFSSFFAVAVGRNEYLNYTQP